MLRVINIRVVVPERVRRKDYECLLFTSHLFLPSLYTIWRNKGTFNHIYSYQCSTFLFHSLLQLYISHHFRWRFAEFIKSCVGKRVRAIPFIHNVFISSAQYCMSPNSFPDNESGFMNAVTDYISRTLKSLRVKRMMGSFLCVN